MSDTIGVIGATRGTGLEVMRQLIASGRPAVAVARNLEKARGLFGDKATLVYGDVTRPETLAEAIDPAWAGLVFTVDISGGIGGRGMFAGRESIRAVMYGGLVNAVEAAKKRGFTGRVVLLSTIGLSIDSTSMKILNWIKSGLRDHSLDKGEYLKRSGVEWTIVRAGILNNKAPGKHTLLVTGEDLPLQMRYQIGRADLARLMLASVTHPAVRNREFSAFWGEAGHDSDEQLAAKLATAFGA
ncbi:NAD(P)H-binding protein [Immundisolibacter sp.]|uniref:NAD(P)H-binding protein n=1 Tax=Immundisolibacter sp. TaxID=1934948 RepID=UPI00356B573F